jgi:putative endonuclease
MKHIHWLVYILICSDETLYTGVTNDIERRIKQHNGEVAGGAKYTHTRQPCTVVYTEKHQNRSDAQKREYEIKSLTKKQKLEIIQKASRSIK